MFVPFARYSHARFTTEQFVRWIGIYKHYWRSFQFAWLAQGLKKSATSG